MNEVVTVLSFVILAVLVVTASRLGTISLFVLSVTYIFLSNITISIPIRVFGVEFSWALIVYSLVYFITNLVCEFRGRRTAYRLAITNVGAQILLWGYIWSSLALTPAQSGKDGYIAMNQLLGTTKQISVAALLASIGPFLGIFVYSWLRQKWDGLAARLEVDSTTVGRLLKSRTLAIVTVNKLSTFAGQIVNTVVFFTVSNFNSETDTSIIVSIIVSSCAVKCVVAIADVPFLVIAVNLMTAQGQLKTSSDVVEESLRSTS